MGIRLGIRDKDPVITQQLGGRKYKHRVQKGAGTSQTSLNEFWIGKERKLRTWSEEMKELNQLDITQAKASQESVLSYV